MKKLILALCSVSSIAISVPAFGQAASNENDDALASSETIVVTARRRDEDVQSVPVVISTVTAETVNKLNLHNFADIQSLVPGLALSSAANGFGASAQIRGVTYDGNSSAQPSVEFYLNDAPITSAYVQQQMFDIGQIEVQRGPQGTLRGRASPSGAITVTTKKPNLAEAGGFVSMDGSNIGTLNFNGAVGVPLIKDVLAVRVAGLWTEDEVNRVRTVNTALDGRDAYARTRAGRVSAVLQPSDWLRLEGVYQHVSNTSRSFDQYASFSLVSPTAPVSPRLITPSDRLSIEETQRNVKQKLNMFNWRAELSGMGQKLTYQGQYAKMDTTSSTDIDAANFFKNRDFFQLTTGTSHTESHELRLQNEDRIAGMFDYVIGAFDWAQISPTTLLVDTPVTLPAFLGGSIVAVAQTPIATSQTVKERSFFGNVTAHVGEKFELSAGARRIHFTSPSNNLTIGGNALPGAAAINDYKWVYSASAQYFVTPDFMIYANTGTSYRPGPTIVGNFTLAPSARENDFKFMKAESSTSYEIGLKSTFWDKRARFNLTGFHQKFDNYTYKVTTPIYYQNFTFVSGTGVVPVVAASAQFAAPVPVEVNGVEAELGLKVTPNFDLSVVASYTSGKIKNGLIPCDDLNGDRVADSLTTAPSLAQIQAAYGASHVGICSTNQRSSNQSPFSASVQANYTLPISDKVDFFARGLLAYQGNSLTDPSNAFDDLGSYGLLDMFAGIRSPDGAWEVNLFAKNVLNTTKATSFSTPATTSYQELQPPTFTTTAGATGTSTYSIITTTRPREFGLNVRFALGSR